MRAERAGKGSRSSPKRTPTHFEEEIYRQVLDSMPLGVGVLRLDDPSDLGSLRILKVNPAASRMVGPKYPVEQEVGKTLRESFHEALTTDVARRLAEVIGTGLPQDLGDIRGTRDPERVLAVKAFPLSGQCVGIVFEDVTAQRQAEAHIRRSERQLARAQQLGQMGSWIWDVQADRLVWSDELYCIYGLSPETFCPTFTAFLERVHPDDRPMVEDTVRRALESREPFRQKERILRPNGEIRVLDTQGDVVLDEHGRLVEMLGLCRDITEEELAFGALRDAQKALRESEERFAKTLQASPVAICLLRLEDGRVINVNARFLELLGHDSAAAVIGNLAVNLGLWAAPGEFERIIADLRQRGSVRETTVPFRTREGQPRRALVSLESIEASGERCVLASFWRT